jgi:hypothetical protein
MMGWEKKGERFYRFKGPDIENDVSYRSINHVVGLVGCVGLNPKFARECSIHSPKVQVAVMGKSRDAQDSEMIIE